MSTDKRARQKENRQQKQASELIAYRRSRIIDRAKQVTIVVVLLAAGLVVLKVVNTDDSTNASSDDTATGSVDDATSLPNVTAPSDENCPEADGSSPRTIDFESAQPLCINLAQDHVAVFDTSEGEIRVDLATASTPMTVNNFVTLARWHYYDGTTIFRSDPTIDIIQGGSPHTESASDPGPGYNIADEPAFDVDDAGQVTGPYRYQPGQLVMARSAGPNSASAQFFFTTGANAALLDGQGSYVVFGETDEAGLEVLQGIIGLHEPGGSLGGAPSRTVTVNSVTIETS